MSGPSDGILRAVDEVLLGAFNKRPPSSDSHWGMAFQSSLAVLGGSRAQVLDLV